MCYLIDHISQPQVLKVLKLTSNLQRTKLSYFVFRISLAKDLEDIQFIINLT